MRKLLCRPVAANDNHEIPPEVKYLWDMMNESLRKQRRKA